MVCSVHTWADIAHTQGRQFCASNVEADRTHGFCALAVGIAERHWQEQWADSALHGYRPGRRAEDVWIDLALSVESAMVDGSYLMVMSIGWSKYVDRVPQEIAIRLAERQGINSRVLQPLRGMYRELRRRFVVDGHVGMKFAASNGIIQGCLLTVLILNLLMNTWARSMKVGPTAAMPKVFADDAGVFNKNSEDVDVAFKITQYFARVTQQKRNVEKAKVWGTTATALQSARDFVLNGEHLDVVSKLKSLGIQVCKRDDQ